MLAVYPTTDGPLVRGFYTMASGSGIVLIPLPHVRFRPSGEDTFEKCGVQREERRERDGKKEGTESESEEARKERRKEGSKLRRQRGRKRRKRIEKGSPECRLSFRGLGERCTTEKAPIVIYRKLVVKASREMRPARAATKSKH